MKCTKLRRLLADSGPAGLAGNREAEDHLVDCGDCYAVLEAMIEIDGMLPGLESLDVADEVVEQLLSRTELKETPGPRVAAPKGRLAGLWAKLGALHPTYAVKRLGSVFDNARQARLRWGIVAVPAVILIGVVSILTIRSVHGPLILEVPYKVQKTKFEDSLAGSDERANREEWEEHDPQSGLAGTGVAANAGEGGGDGSSRLDALDQSGSGATPKPTAKRVFVPGPASDQPESGKELNGVTSEPISVAVLNQRAALGYPEAPAPAAQETVETKRDQNYYRQESAVVEDVELESDDSFYDAKDRSLLGEMVTEIDDDALSAAHRFLAERNRVEDLMFREARGYWANTYVPGDRTLRQLKARLDQAAGAGGAGTLHENAHQITQPFDPPDGAALAVYLHSDRPGVETRERMLVQVGLKATSRRSGMRPAMNIGLVLDLRGGVTPESASAMRALLQAFAASSELGDRFSLTVAGRPGGTVLQPGDLRHGPLTVALTELFGDDASGPVLDLEQALTAALATVRADDDPNAPLGSSALMLITSREYGVVTGDLVQMAHRSAVDGVPWSAIGIGRGVDLAELDSLVLAGQGNRRLLETAADAEALVDRELAAVSRVVARAVRLRIRLAPGVQLIDVIGSGCLDENRAQRVRDAEQSIDQRLSRYLGIETDRGLDEEGIQIVIPSYYADDAHVVLLDVVAPGPGPVADVTVRYKDLVQMKNGVARAHLRVDRAGTAAGPLELNVLANLLATEVASALDGAADAVAVADIDGARVILAETLDLLRGVISLVDGLAQNADLEADLEMLSCYIDALSTVAASDPGRLQAAADSLRYAGRLKILPPPVGDDLPE